LRRFRDGPETKSAEPESQRDLTSEKAKPRGPVGGHPAPIADAGQTRSPNATSSRTNFGVSSTTIIWTSQSPSLRNGNRFYVSKPLNTTPCTHCFPCVTVGAPTSGHHRRTAHAYLDVNVETRRGGLAALCQQRIFPDRSAHTSPRIFPPQQDRINMAPYIAK
jgi:hypothetical protein